MDTARRAATFGEALRFVADFDRFAALRFVAMVATSSRKAR
jgi:hypothetical protein